MGLERIRLTMKAAPGLTFQQAFQICQAGNIFTTHTPVPAGLERFEFDQVNEFFAYLWKEFELTREQFFDLGREKIGSREVFSMAVCGDQSFWRGERRGSTARRSQPRNVAVDVPWSTQRGSSHRSHYQRRSCGNLDQPGNGNAV